jgi:hypothetical protein
MCLKWADRRYRDPSSGIANTLVVSREARQRRTITNHRNGIATDYEPGVGWARGPGHPPLAREQRDHPAIEISVDIVQQE